MIVYNVCLQFVQFQVEQWQMLANCLGDLTILSELHESDEIKLNAKKLRNLIEINAQIIQHHMGKKHEF